MRPGRGDVLLAGGITVFGVLEVYTSNLVVGPRAANAAFVIAIGVLLLFRRRAPLAFGAAALAVIVVFASVLSRPDELTYFFLPCMLVAYSFGAYLERRGAIIGFVLLLVAITGVNIAMGSPADVFPLVFMSLALLAGRVVRARSQVAAELHEAVVRAEEARERESVAAVADERRRIAREMHDVVAHSMSVMVVQAGGARRILDRDPARAEAAAAQIERTGREALAEMRRLLGVLRPGDEGRSPQPRLDGLDGLVERARDAGLPVQLQLTGERPALPAGAELAAYRIVQEGLTNAIKHAGSAPTRVTVHYGDEVVEITVENDPPGIDAYKLSTANGHEPGHGLVGMRERVRVFGGELRAGTREGGGYTVHATLPLGQ